MKLKPSKHAIERFAQRYKITYTEAKRILPELEWRENRHDYHHAKKRWNTYYVAEYNGQLVEGPVEKRTLITVLPEFVAQEVSDDA